MSVRGEWIELRPRAEQVQRALDREQESFRHSTLFGQKGLARAGYLAEELLAEYLCEYDVAVTLNGGFDHEPDMAIKTHSIGIKSTMQPERVILGRPHAIIPNEQLDQPWDWWFFAATIDDQTNRTFLVGGITTEDFRKYATPSPPHWRHPAHVLKFSDARILGLATCLKEWK